MEDAESASRLKGKKVLVVEDETLISMLFEDILTDLECEIVGPALNIRQARELASSSPIDIAVLDVNLSGEPIWPVAELLADRRVPMIFSSGYGLEGLPERWRNYPSLPKPFTFDQVTEAMTKIVAGN